MPERSEGSGRELTCSVVRTLVVWSTKARSSLRTAASLARSSASCPCSPCRQAAPQAVLQAWPSDRFPAFVHCMTDLGQWACLSKICHEQVAALRTCSSARPPETIQAGSIKQQISLHVRRCILTSSGQHVMPVFRDTIGTCMQLRNSNGACCAGPPPNARNISSSPKEFQGQGPGQAYLTSPRCSQAARFTTPAQLAGQ